MVNLVDGQDRGGGVIERRGKSLGGDVDDDPEDEGRVLPHGPVVADADRLSQRRGSTESAPVTSTRQKSQTWPTQTAQAWFFFRSDLPRLGFVKRGATSRAR